MAADVVLATFNARYAHASFGLRCLRANLGVHRARCVLEEATLATRPAALAERILAHRPRVVGLGVYVWNARESLALARILKALEPSLVVVIGGPEVSHETEAQEICQVADHVVRGEGERAFFALCEGALGGNRLALAAPKIIDGGSPPLSALVLPYREYTEEDIAHRTVYVEASRGCPFRCAFCLSALDRGVRAFPLEALLSALQELHDRGLRQFKFVDRTFNLAIDDALAILEFFVARCSEELFLHFEMIPDRLPEPLLAMIDRFPPGSIQLEVGIQTFDPTVAKTIGRRTNHDQAVKNIIALRKNTGAHIHADLIAGLPGETWSSLAVGFDRLVEADPQEIQLGTLKRLRGTPLTQLDGIEHCVFDLDPPYEILRTPTMSFEQLSRVRKMAWVWDRAFNQGRAPRSTALLRNAWKTRGSVFAGLDAFTQRVAAQEHAFAGISLARLLEWIYRELQEVGVSVADARAAIDEDHASVGRGKLSFLREDGSTPPVHRSPRRAGPPPRQRRHLEAVE